MLRTAYMIVNAQDAAPARMDGGRVLRIILTAAVLIVLLRIPAPFEVGSDQSVQLEAASRLAGGLGLTTTHNQPSSIDFNAPFEPRVLASWPPGFSIIVAGLLKIGLPLLFALKLLYSLVTLVGWTGWGLLIRRFLSGPIEIGAKRYPIHLLMVALLPVLFTPKWDGTDIFLWTVVPYLVILLNGSKFSMAHPVRSAAAAGLLFGFACSIRYASAFAGAAAALVLIQSTWPRIREFLLRASAFGFSALLFLVPTAIHAFNGTQDRWGIPGMAAMVDEEVLTSSDTLSWIVGQLPSASNLLIGGPLLAQFVYKAHSHTVSTVIGIVFTCILGLIPLLFLRSHGRNHAARQQDLSLTLTLFSLALFVFLAVVGLGSFLSVNRYYEPAGIFIVLVCYKLLLEKRPQMVRIAATTVLVCFFLNVGALLAVVPSAQKRWQLVNEVLGFIPPRQAGVVSTTESIRYSELRMYSRLEGTRAQIRQLHGADPDAVFIAWTYGYLVYDRMPQGPEPGNLLRPFGYPDYWKQAQVLRPRKIYWVMDLGGKLDLVPVSNQKLIYENPFERTKIVESSIPEGFKFGSKS